jgi:multicomponent Na+:H+ antiporter subunit G
MSIRHALAVAFLIGGVVVELICCIGLIAVRNAFDRLHYLGPASSVGPLAIAAAVLIEESFTQAGVKSLLVALLLLLKSPVLTHATARAMRIHEEGRFQIHNEELVEKS